MGSHTGSRLAALRQEHGLSQEQLAEQLGVSRQAVSNWERAESLPYMANLVSLADFYRISIDELVGRDSTAPQSTSAKAALPASNRHFPDAWILVLAALLTGAYYALASQPLAWSSVNDVTEVFGLTLGPALAVTWFVAEVVFVLVPFVLLAIVPLRLPRRTWIGALLAFVLLTAAMLLPAAFAGASWSEYAGIGGALAPSLALKADVFALIAGCVLADAALRHRIERPQRAEAAPVSR